MVDLRKVKALISELNATCDPDEILEEVETNPYVVISRLKDVVEHHKNIIKSANFPVERYEGEDKYSIDTEIILMDDERIDVEDVNYCMVWRWKD
jgi:hypothetical protein